MSATPAVMARVHRGEDRPQPRAHACVPPDRVHRLAVARPDVRPVLHLRARPSVIGRVGWWEVLSKPSQATFDNYRELFHNEAITHSIVTTLWISIGGTILPIIIAAFAGYAFAWLEFPGRDWLFLSWSGCSSSRSRWR